MEYNFTTIEKKWQKFWKDNQSFKTVSKPTDKKYYVLEMFPYPSGKMHMGHVSNYTIADSIARYYKLLGYDILHPMGWDAFGMPAENAAIEHKTHPAEWTLKNIANMKEQLNLLGYSYDWDREVTTCLPDYYKWGQWFILKMYEKGLLYRKGGDVNWCDHCNTVLANEQVTPEGTCWRCDGEVTKKKLEQWYIKVTDYAEQLDADLKLLEGYWPDNVIAMQKNWIGKSVGAYINFNLDDGKEFPIFTTRPDTIYGVTYMAIAWNYDGLLDMCTPEQRSAVEEFIKKSAKIDQKTDYEKEGVFTGRYVVNPFNGEKAPLYAANFVLAEYGSGAVMAVPAHDQRDFEFAKKYNIPVKVVIQNADNSLKAENMTEAYTEDGTVVNSDILKHINIFLNANVKDSLCYTDFILIRFNKIFVVEFSYQLVSVVNHNELKEAKVQFFTQQIEQCLKRYLPVDTVVKTFNFVIKDDKYNNGNIERLAQEINNYYEKTTSKELLKILR